MLVHDMVQALVEQVLVVVVFLSLVEVLEWGFQAVVEVVLNLVLLGHVILRKDHNQTHLYLHVSLNLKQVLI